MQRILAFIALAAVVAFAQQNGPLTLNYLTSGSTVSATIAPSNYNTAYNLDLYALWVPENTSYINVTLANTNTGECSFVYLFARSHGLPCSVDDFDSSDYLCANSWTIDYVGSTVENAVAYPGDESSLFEFVVNQYVYFGVGRYYASDNDSTCAYTLNVAAVQTCNMGQIAVQTTSNTVTCVTYSVPVSGTQYPVTGTGTDFYAAYKVAVPQNTAYILVTLNSTVTSTDIYGKSYGAPYESSGYNCYTTSYDVTVGSFYIYNLFCYTPRAGDFYFTVMDDSAFTATISFTVNTCAGNTGGYNCTYVSVPLNSTTALTTGASITVPYAGLNYGFAYYYVDIPANYTGGQLTVAANSANSGYLFIRRDGFPEEFTPYGYEDSNQYSVYPASFTVNQFEWAVAGRIYFGIQCRTSPSCVISLSANATAPITSASSNTGVSGVSGSATTGSSSGVSGGVTTGFRPTPTTGLVITTGSEDSSVAALVPAFVLAAVALLF